jgi:putative transposase
MNTHPIEEAYPQRRNLRLRNYDYTHQGAYFITVCTYNKQLLFGNINESTMRLNPLGEIVDSVWKDIPHHFPEVKNEIFIVMPNHVHGIIVIQETGRSGHRPAPTEKHSLTEIVRAFKSFSSLKINKCRQTVGIPVWQRGYFEHVIRNEKEYSRIGEYIIFNTGKWETDRENPNAPVKDQSLPFEY